MNYSGPVAMMVSGYPSSDEESTAYHTPSTSVVGRSFMGGGGGGTTPKNKLLTNGSLLTRSLKKKQQESTKTTGSAARKSNRNDPTSSGQVKRWDFLLRRDLAKLHWGLTEGFA